MSLEFNKVVEQVRKLGNMIDELDFDLSEKLLLARERFDQASDLDRVWERVEWVRGSSVSGYRGAAPLDTPNAEAVNQIVSPPQVPDQALIIAADGSQIYPNETAKVHYYLLNIGVFAYFHGIDRTPEQMTFPKLYFHKDHVHDRYGRLIRNRTVDDRRTVAEMHALARECWERRQAGVPLFALYDNRLLYLPGENVRPAENLLRDYLAALVHLHDSGALLAGYVDNPLRSKRFMQLLYLMTLQSPEEVRHKQVELSEAGDLSGLRDQHFFEAILREGERSAVMVQNSPQNYTFKERGVSYEIAFFYLKVSRDHVVRVDLPLWVARDAASVDLLHATLLSQCRLQGRNPYPYSLTRADELAVVTSKDKDKLEELINTELRRREIDPHVYSAKNRGKELARSPRRPFEI